MIFGVFFTLILSSCTHSIESSENATAPNESTIHSNYTWFLDNLQVSEGTFDPIDSNLWVVTILQPNTVNYSVHAFTSSLGYANFGPVCNLPLNKYVAFENEVNKHRLPSGELSDETVNAIYARIFNNANNTTSNRTPFILGWDICQPTSSQSTVILQPQPFYVTMNNQVSAVEGSIAVYVGIVGWDKSWFRKRLGTFGFWAGPGNKACLPFFLDNKISSSIHT